MFLVADNWTGGVIECRTGVHGVSEGNEMTVTHDKVEGEYMECTKLTLYIRRGKSGKRAGTWNDRRMR